MATSKDRFEWFVRKLYGRTPQGKEGSAALPTTIAETVRALDPRALQTIARSTLASAPFLLTLEESQIPGTSLRYILVHDEIGPAGFLLLSIVHLDLTGVIRGASRSPDPLHRRTLGKAGSLLAPAGRKADPSQARIAIGGHPLFRGSHFLEFRDPEPTASVLATMVRAAYRVREQEGISVSLLKDLPAEDLPRLAPLEKYGYVSFETQPGLVLRIDPRWKSFDAYLASLPAQARKLIRDRRRAFDQKGLVIERARPTPVAAELAELYAGVWHQSPGRLALLTPYFFRAVEDHLRDAFSLWVVRKDRRIIAFICAVHDKIPAKGRNRLLGLFVGLDWRLNEELRLYSNLHYRLIEEAIAGGFEVLDLGRAALQLQAELGAQPEPLHCLVRHDATARSPLLRIIFEQIIYPSRSPEHHA